MIFEIPVIIFIILVMKVKLDVSGIPMLREAVGKKRFEMEFDGCSVRDLINEIIKRYGQKARDALLDSDGNLDLLVQVLVNGSRWVGHEHLDTTLSEGDTISLMIFLAGG